MGTHTPGPWRIVCGVSGLARGIDAGTPQNHPGGIQHVVRFNGLGFPSSPEGQANARLIAAAPDLLEALQHMRWCRSCAEGGWEDCEDGRKALAALAKAEGSEKPEMQTTDKP